MRCRLRVMRHLCNDSVMPTNELITTPEAARLLYKSARSVHRMVEAGTLVPVTKLPGPNGAFLFDRAAIEAAAKAVA